MSQKRPVTLQDVADLAGVSRGAASFALTNRSGVSAATRERVRAAAAELGYRPNPTARNLRTSRTGIVAVYLPRVAPSLSYYAAATFGVLDEAQDAGYLVTLVPRPTTPTPLPALHADGVIAIDPIGGDPVLDEILGSGIPVVSGEAMPEGYAPTRGEVRSDHAATTRELLDHFDERGARSPAIIVPDTTATWSTEIERAYSEWCAAHGRRGRIERVGVRGLGIEGITASTIAATRRLLDASDPADAIIALSEGSVLNVVTSAKEFGRRIGDDLLVAAAVDSPTLQYTEPPITAVDLRPHEFGRALMRVMRDVLDGKVAPGETRRLVVPIEVVLRESTAGTTG